MECEIAELYTKIAGIGVCQQDHWSTQTNKETIQKSLHSTMSPVGLLYWETLVYELLVQVINATLHLFKF